MEKGKKHIFVIGNGFDFVLHGLRTKYSDFRDYVLKKYPNACNYTYLAPSLTMMPDGGMVMDMNDAAGYILRVIDECEGDAWSNLEGDLGRGIFDSFISELEDVNWDEDDKSIRHAFYTNEDRSSDIKETFRRIKKLFYDWVNDELSNVLENASPNSNAQSVFEKYDDKVFLNFNYTETLEQLYGIKDVCHIHGCVGDAEEDIVFGHGDMEQFYDSDDVFGAIDNFIDLKSELRKDTRKAISKHQSFFDIFSEAVDVHSFGFGFGDVDMIYVEKIAETLGVKNRDVVWYLSKYDYNECPAKGAKSKKDKLEELGFHVEVERLW